MSEEQKRVRIDVDLADVEAIATLQAFIPGGQGADALSRIETAARKEHDRPSTTTLLEELGTIAEHAKQIAERLKGDPVLLEELRVVHGLHVSTQPSKLPVDRWIRDDDGVWRRALESEQAELATLRRMREALVKLRDQMATEDTEETAAADRITEVLAMSAAPVKPSKAEPIEQPTPLPVPAGLDPRGAAICERPFGCIACQGPPTPLSEHRHRTIEALLTAIDREATDPTGHDPAGLDGAQRAERLANAVALLAGASL